MSNIIEEYEKAIKILEERIEARKKKLRTLSNQGKILSDDAYIIKNELVTLEGEYNDTIMALHELKQYYS